jgi:hypothetical protein
MKVSVFLFPKWEDGGVMCRLMCQCANVPMCRCANSTVNELSSACAKASADKVRQLSSVIRQPSSACAKASADKVRQLSSVIRQPSSACAKASADKVGQRSSFQIQHQGYSETNPCPATRSFCRPQPLPNKPRIPPLLSPSLHNILFR